MTVLPYKGHDIVPVDETWSKIDIFLLQQYEERLQEDERKFQQYQDRIQVYKEKIDEVNQENEQLRRSHRQAVNMVQEIKMKLNFSQGMVFSVRNHF